MIESGHMPAENGKYTLLQKCSEEVAGWWTALHRPIRPALAQLKEEKGTTEDEMVGWHHRLNGHGFGWTPRVSGGQGGLTCFSSWCRKVSDMTERLN